MNNNQYSHKINPNTSAISFSAAVSGDYKINIAFKHPNDQSASTTATIATK